MTVRFPAVRAAVLVTCILAFAGCGATRGLFGKKSGAEAKPAALVEFKPSLAVTRMWSMNVGKGDARYAARQRPVVDGGQVFAAAGSSGVRALDLATGKVIWSYAAKTRKGESIVYSGGPGVGEGLVVIGGLDGEVIALDRATGAERWRAKVNNEVLAAPAIGNALVIVHSNDGHVTAFDAASGERRWQWAAEPVALSTRGNSAPVIASGMVYVGTANGRLVALNLADGVIAWEGTVADPDGRSEIARMNDVDGQPVIDGGVVYASSYKPRTAAFDAANGQPAWVQEHGGAGGVGLSPDRVVITDSSDTVWGMDRASGAPMWQQAGFLRRRVSAPAVQGAYAVVGDQDGYLHWLRLADGQLAARARVGSKPIIAQPVVADGVLLVQDSEGGLTAFRAGN